MRNAVAKLVVGSVVAFGVLQGCASGTPPSEKDIVCEFVSPLQDAQLMYSDDLNLNTPDFDLSVELAIRDLDGQPVEVENATLQQRKTSETGFSDGPSASVSAGKVIFAGVQLPPNGNELKFSAKAKGSELRCTKSITVNVGYIDPAVPAVLSVGYPADENGDKRLNRAEMPLPANANSAVVRVTTQNVEDGQKATVKDAITGAVYGSGTIENGSADVTLSALPNVPEANYALVVEVMSQKGIKNQISNATAPNFNAAAFSTLRVDLVLPTLSFTCPSKELFGLNDDDKKGAGDPGFQLKVCGQASPDTVKVLIRLGSAAEVECGTGCLEAGSAVAYLNVATSGTTSQELQATAVDDSGNKVTISKTLTFDFEPPTINITKPLASNGALLFWRNTFEADVTGADGQMATIYRTSTSAPTEVALDSKQVTSGKVSWEGTFPSSGTYNLVARVSDLAGNEAVADFENGIEVSGTGCSITITGPSTRPGYLTPKDDADVATPGIQKTLNATSMNCNNTSVTLTVNGANPQTLTTSGSGAVAFPLSFSTGGTYNIRVEIENGAPQPPTPDSMDIVVDLNKPLLVAPSSAQKLLVVNNDSQRQVPGVQRLLQYTASVPTGARVDICFDSANPPVGAASCPTGESGWWVLDEDVASQEVAFSFPDGVYKIKPVIVWPGVGYNDGEAISLTVDSIRPTVTQVVSFLNDSAPLGKLNISELTASGGSPKLQIVTSEEVKITVEAQIGGTVFTSAETSTTSNSATVTLDSNITSTEADYAWRLVLKDVNGNTNILTAPTASDPLDSNAFVSARVDKLAPSCVFTAPTKLQLGVADDADGALPGYQLRASISTSADVSANGALLALSGGASQNATVNVLSSSVTHDFNVSNAGTEIYNIAATCVDESGNSTAASAISNVVVDNDVPSCNLTAPTAAGGPYGFYSIPTAITVGGDNTSGLTARVFTQVGSAPELEIGTLTVLAGSASGSLTYPNGTQNIRVSVTDLAGNTCSNPERQQSGVVVNGVGCDLTVVAPTSSSYVNQSLDSNPATATVAEISVIGGSTNCNSGETVEIFLNGSSTPSASGTVNGTGQFTIPLSLAEGTYTVTARINNGASVFTSKDVTNVSVDLTPPVVATVYPTGSNLYFVSAVNQNVGPNPASPLNSSYVIDTAAGGNANFTVGLTGVTGADNGQIRVLYGSTPVATSSVSSGVTTYALQVELPHNSNDTFKIEVTDEAGNKATPTNAAAVVDVIAPSAPNFLQAPQIVDARRATVRLSWEPSFDDDTSGSGANAGYDIRWTFNGIHAGGTNETTTMIESDYFDSTKTKQESLVSWSASNITQDLTLPPMSTYYIALRAKDEVGNYSTFQTPTAVVNTALNYTLTESSNGYAFFAASNGSLNNDGIDDLVVSAASANKVFIYYGEANFGSTNPTTCALPGCQTLTGANSFGNGLAVGNVGDSAGENKPDLIIPATSYSTSTGRVFVYFGTNSAASIDTSTFVELRGTTTNTSFGITVQTINDINGDGLMELAVAATGELSNQGKIFIYKGRSVADWLALRTAVDGSAVPYVPTSNADWVIEGPTPVDPTGTTSNLFGRERGGLTSLGDVTGDGVNDFSVPASKNSINRVYLYSGAAVAAASGAVKTLNDPSSCPSGSTCNFQALNYGGVGTDGDRTGFGRRAVGAVNVIGASKADLLVGHPLDQRIYIFGDPTSTFASTPSLTIEGIDPSFGSWFQVADLNADGVNDIVTGPGNSINVSVRTFYGRSGSFDTIGGAGFYQSRIYRAGTSSLGGTIAVGDFDGNGQPDLALCETTVPSGSARKVVLWRP